MPTFDNKESGLSVRNKLNDVIIAIEKIDTGDVAKVADIEQEVKDVAAIDTEVSTVAGISSDVSTVSTNVSDVQTVASDLNETTSDIEVVSADITNVNNVASNIGNVNTVAGISTDVTAVAGDEADIGVVAADITNVNTVSTSIADVETTAGSISDVETVSTNISDVSTTAGSISDVQTVASDLNKASSDIEVVSTNISDVNTVADALDQPLSAASGVSYDDSASGLDASDVQGAIDAAVESFVGRKEQIAQGFIQREQTRGDLDVDLAVAIELNLLGAPVAGGYYAGLIDTLTGNIISADDYQTGLRYALIVSPKDLEGGRGASPASGLPSGDLEWDTQDRSGEAGCFTRWNGLEATNVIIAKDEAAYEVHGFIADVRSQYPAPSTPGGSEWYLPAMDELELLYRNFKPNNADNRDDTRNRTFPGTQVVGTNPSSAIEGFQYENSPRIPDVTFLDLFKEGNAQSLDQLRYWSTTDADEGGRAWSQYFTLSGGEGLQRAPAKGLAVFSVRPVRRVVL